MNVTIPPRALLQLVRWPNLLIIALAQLLLRYCLIIPLYQNPFVNYTTSLTHFDFVLLIISTLCIAGAGYVINDYFDVATDMVNKPHKVIIGKSIAPPIALNYYYLLNVIGLLLGFYIAYIVGHPQLIVIQLLTAISLWLYSTSWKKKAIWGNLLIAFVVAMSILIVAIYDFYLYQLIQFRLESFFRTLIEALTGFKLVANQIVAVPNYELLNFIFNYILGYSVFAFLLTLVREIIKDIEDIEGDKNSNYRTLPIVAGTGITKIIALLPCLLTLKLLFDFQIQQLQFQQYISILFILFAIQIPLFYFIFKLFKAQFKADYHHLSQILKFVMLFGIVYLAYFYYTIEQPQKQDIINNYEILNYQIKEENIYKPTNKDTFKIDTSLAPTPKIVAPETIIQIDSIRP